MSKNGPSYTGLDANQTVTQAFDEPNDAHRVVPLIGGVPVSATNPIVTSPLPFKWDYVALVLSNGNTTETYTFRNGTHSVAGTITGTVVINYVDSTRAVMLNATVTAV